MDIRFKKDIRVLYEPFDESDLIETIKGGTNIKYKRTMKINDSNWIVTENGYILVEVNNIQEIGEYIIETFLEKNKIIELDDCTLKINNMAEQYFLFKPINEEDYLVYTNNFILGIGRTKDGNLSIKKYDPNDGIDDSKKWNLIRINENIFKIKNKFFGYYMNVPEGNTEIGTKILLSSESDLASQYFYLWKKNISNELHISHPFDSISDRMIEKIKKLRYIEIDNYIDKIECDLKKCLFLEKVNCCCKHLKFFKYNNLKEIIIREDETHIKKDDFKYFKNLKSITLPQSLVDIEKDTFKDMTFIKKINGNSKWNKYFNIYNIKIESGEKKSQRETFYQGKNLKKVDLPNKKGKIDEGCFENRGIKENLIPTKVKFRPKNIFKNSYNLRQDNIPDTINEKDNTIFSNCKNLESENVSYPIKFRNTPQKKLKINKNIICKEDYNNYLEIEEIEIPLNTTFIQEEDKKLFLNKFINLIKVKMDPKLFKFIDTSKIISIIIPEGITNLESYMFANCKSLEYLEIPQSVIEIDREDIFSKCTHLKSAKLPDDFIIRANYLFYNCYELKTIKNMKDETIRFKLIYKIKEGEEVLNLENLSKIKNLSILIIPSSIKKVNKCDYELSECLECVEGDPKWLKYLPIYQLKKIIIPEDVDIIDKNDFKSAENIKEIVIKGCPRIIGNKCKDFENIPHYNCFPLFALYCPDEVKESCKTITINNQCIEIEKKSFKDWKGLRQINFPKTLEIIGEEAFANCINLFHIEIPDSVKKIHETSFNGCYNLSEIECNGKFLKCFQWQKVKILKIKNNTLINDLDSLDRFKNLEVLELPPHINNLDLNLNKLYKLKCSGELFSNLNQKTKRSLQSIELYPGYFKDNMFNNCNNLQNITLKNHPLENKKINNLHITTIKDIINFDPSNKKYEIYLNKMIKDIKYNIISDYNENDKLDEITNKLTFICLEIKNKSKHKITPHPVQCFAMIRLLDEILYSKGALAEIQTGEGKSYIISVVAIALVLYHRIVDIVTTNLELAFRDEEEHREYFKLFNIKSGVLASNKGDKEFIKLYNSDFKGKSPDPRSEFYIHVLEYPIIYSTNYNYQFLHLYSFFQNNLIRKRKYDIVLIDEVDNMLIDQMIRPAIIGNKAKFYSFENILKDIYNNRDLNEEIIFNKLKKYSEISNIDLDIVKKCKRSARIAKFNELKIDYILEDNKVVIIDQCTGYKQPETRWSKYIHEFCEIKENLKIDFPVLSYCSINQNIYFNLYKKISGVTGTLGNLNDQLILKNNYNINIFKVPRDKIRPKQIIQKTRPKDEFVLYEEIYEEILFEVSKGRPVLVIMDSLAHVENFQIATNIQCNIISGIYFDKDKKSINLAGNKGQITLATSAGGRGVDIKLMKESIEAGGLHVIIPFLLPNERCEIQAFGRSGRQGQPGSASIYRDFERDSYMATPEFNEKDKIKYEIQNKFNIYIGKNWPWIYESKPNLVQDIKFEFNSSVEKVFNEFHPKLRVALVSYAYKDKNDFINDIYSSIIFSWSFFFNNLDWNINSIDINKEYENYIKKLNKWIPINRAIDEGFNHFTKVLHMEEIIDNIIYPKPKFLKNVEMDDFEFLRNEAIRITEGLFNVEIQYTNIDYEYQISFIPRITGKISQSVSIQVENSSETKSIHNIISVNNKSLTPKLSQGFFNLFNIDYSNAIISLKFKLEKLVRNGVISIGFGYKKIQFSISVSRDLSSMRYAGSIIFSIYSQPYKRERPKFPYGKLDPYLESIYSYGYNFLPNLNRKYNYNYNPSLPRETQQLKKPESKSPNIGKWFEENKETIQNFAKFTGLALAGVGICLLAPTAAPFLSTLRGVIGTIICCLA